MVEKELLDIEEIVRDSFDEEEVEQLGVKLSQLEPEEIAVALEAMPLEQRISTWQSLEPDEQIHSLNYMREDARKNIFLQLDEAELTALVERMDVDDLIEMLDELPTAVYRAACLKLDASEKLWLATALAYTDEQCGRYADHDVLTILKNAKVRDASWAVAYGLCMLGASENEDITAIGVVKQTKRTILGWLSQFLP